MTHPRGDSPVGGALKRPLPRPVILLSWVSFFADVSSEMAYPVVPLLVVGVLGATTTALGWIEGVGALAVALLAAFAGWRSDARGHRAARRVPWVRVGYALPVLGRLMIALAPAWGFVLVGRTVDRIGKGIRGAPRDALIADATPEDMRGRAFGFHRFMDTLGAFLGVLASAAMVLALVGAPGLTIRDPSSRIAPGSLGPAESAIRWILGIAAIVALASVAVTLRIRENPAEPRVALASGTPPQRARFSPTFHRTLATLALFALANSTDAFILLRFAELGLTPGSVILAYALYNLVYALASSPAGRLSDRFGRTPVILVGWLFYAAVYALLAGALRVSNLIPLSAIPWITAPLYGVYAALTDGVGKALATDVAPLARRGAAIGLFALASGVATLVGSVAFGAVWHRFGAPTAFSLAALLALIATVLGALTLPRRGAPSS